MAHSLELRVPFLDPVVAELALALPVAARVRGFAKKRLLRSAVEPLVGREIARGRKKGFSIPAAAWLRGELEPFCREVLGAERLRAQGYFDPAAVTRLIDEHVAPPRGPLTAAVGADELLAVAGRAGGGRREPRRPRSAA